MPKNFYEDIVEQIRARADIVEVISAYIGLEKKGQNFWGLCPFHHEKTPSFSVNKDKQMYYCFGCGAGGNVFNFIMKRENLIFSEALDKLANRYGVMLPEKQFSIEQKARNKKKERIIAANHLAAKYFNYLLTQSQGLEAKKYLAQRGISELEIEKFQLGYAIENWEGFYGLATQRGFSEEELLEAGLVVKREKGTGVYDRFRNRVMFTIFNSIGEPIGFGGRVLDNSLPKYLNTSETFIFNKRNTLYGLNWAGQSIRKQGYAIIMEGYMDTIAAQQMGIENVVASLGTALTKEQAQLIKRYTNKVIFCYDSDDAGEKAVLRGLDVLRSENLQVKVISLPKGLDPDGFIRKEGKEAFLQAALYEAQSLVEYKLNYFMKNQGSTKSDMKVEIFNQIRPDLLKVQNAIEREEYIKLVAAKLEIPDRAIRDELTRYFKQTEKYGIYRHKKEKNRDTINGLALHKINRPPSALEQAEEKIFFFMVQDKVIREQVQVKLGYNFFSNSLLEKLINEIKEKWDLGQEVSPAWVMTKCASEDEQLAIAKIFSKEVPDNSVRDKLVQDCINVIIQRQKQDKIDGLREQLKKAEINNDFINMKKLLTEIKQLMS